MGDVLWYCGSHRIIQNTSKKMFIVLCNFQPANGLRYPRVGGVWIRSEGSINPKPEKSLKMPQTPTRRVHALLARFGFAEYLS